MATGVALSMRLKPGGIVACFFGDGAAAEGVFHESLNLAAVWELPILYVCENNQWQAYVHRRETMIGDHISERARGYGVDACTVDGNDVAAVAAAAADAAARVRQSRKPFLLETYTYRLRGHMEPDDQSYVDRHELDAWKRRDPIALQMRRLIDAGEIDPAGLDAIKARVAATIAGAASFAASSPYPGLEEMTTDVYA
jgi:pyruvate dehydrogenase E1 component alpha subunit